MTKFVHKNDTDWVNDHGKSTFVVVMAQPLSNQYIVRCLCKIRILENNYD